MNRPPDRDIISKALTATTKNAPSMMQSTGRAIGNFTNKLADSAVALYDYGYPAVGANILSALAWISGNEKLEKDLEWNRRYFNYEGERALDKIWNNGKSMTDPLDRGVGETIFNAAVTGLDAVPFVGGTVKGVKSLYKAGKTTNELLENAKRYKQAIKRSVGIGNPKAEAAQNAINKVKNLQNAYEAAGDAVVANRAQAKELAKTANILGAPRAIVEAAKGPDYQLPSLNKELSHIIRELGAAKVEARAAQELADRSKNYWRNVAQANLDKVPKLKFDRADALSSAFNAPRTGAATTAALMASGGALNSLYGAMNDGTLSPESVADLNQKLGVAPVVTPVVESNRYGDVNDYGYDSVGGIPQDIYDRLASEAPEKIIPTLNILEQAALGNAVPDTVIPYDIDPALLTSAYLPESPKMPLESSQNSSPIENRGLPLQEIVGANIPQIEGNLQGGNAIPTQVPTLYEVPTITQDYTAVDNSINNLQNTNTNVAYNNKALTPYEQAQQRIADYLGAIAEQTKNISSRQEELKPLLDQRNAVMQQIVHDTERNPLFWLGNLLAAPFKLHRGIDPITAWNQSLESVVKFDPAYAGLTDQINEIAKLSPTQMEQLTAAANLYNMMGQGNQRFANTALTNAVNQADANKATNQATLSKNSSVVDAQLKKAQQQQALQLALSEQRQKAHSNYMAIVVARQELAAKKATAATATQLRRYELREKQLKRQQEQAKIELKKAELAEQREVNKSKIKYYNAIAGANAAKASVSNIAIEAAKKNRSK